MQAIGNFCYNSALILGGSLASSVSGLIIYDIAKNGLNNTAIDMVTKGEGLDVVAVAYSIYKISEAIFDYLEYEGTINRTLESVAISLVGTTATVVGVFKDYRLAKLIVTIEAAVFALQTLWWGMSLIREGGQDIKNFFDPEVPLAPPVGIPLPQAPHVVLPPPA